jgi:hypothetical protein
MNKKARLSITDKWLLSKRFLYSGRALPDKHGSDRMD